MKNLLISFFCFHFHLCFHYAKITKILPSIFRYFNEKAFSKQDNQMVLVHIVSFEGDSVSFDNSVIKKEMELRTHLYLQVAKIFRRSSTQ